MAGAHGGKGVKGGAPGGKGGARNGNGGARSGNGGARSGNGGVRSGNDGAPSGDGRSGNDGARSGNDRAYGGNGGAPSGNGGARSGNDGAPSGNGGTRGRTPKQGFRPPNRGDSGSRGGHDGSGSRGGHDGSGKRGGHDRSGKHGGHVGSGRRGGHDGSGRRGGHDGSGRRGGYAGSSSRQGEGDPIADMCGVFRDPSSRMIPDRDSNHYSEDSDFEDVDHQEADLEDVNRQEVDLEDDEHPLSQRSYEGASHDTNQGRMIRRAGDKFEVEHGDVHKSITRILAEHHDGVWMTFREIPRDVLARMFECFRTRWRWDPASEQLIHEGFINVLKTRYSDIMRHLRITSTRMASVVRPDMDPKNYRQFDIIRDYPPHSMSLEVWRELCRRWNTTGWINKSISGSRNRKSGDTSGSGKSSRHTGGSMGYAERRARMKRKMNEEPNFKQIFLETTSLKNANKNYGTGRLTYIT
ncbi:putative transposase, Ptta/En/Spm, plant [Helianthus annuus]|nr:putative transposase, Ptta/En/Spm, plant [Helianthus annuus]KAJ0608517.1 putative transposase, Ptta/En/Spm, plant [Helianthus annuus]KAJ0768582.1 putative transposase, Ptta/En/Spm, plant [Helianthus annuus]